MTVRRESKIQTILIERGIDKETGLSYTKWENKKCEKTIPCTECKKKDKVYDRYNDLCTIRFTGEKR